MTIQGEDDDGMPQNLTVIYLGVLQRTYSLTAASAS